MSVVAALSEVKKFLQVKSKADVSTLIFKLHRITAALLIACSILTTFRQNFGNNIHCMLGGGSIPLPMFESYCFMSGTYTLPLVLSNITSAHPGVSTGIGGGVEDGTVFHNYYQWVGLLFAIQAALFYLPWGLWKMVEGGKVGKLLAKVSRDPLTETPVTEQVASLGDFLLSHGGWFNSSAVKLLFYQALSLLLTVSQLYAMDLVLGNEFLNLGSNILDLELLTRNLTKVFPIVVKCSMTYFGPSGNLVNNSGLCTLPVNIINEKLYLVLWVWCLALAMVSLLSLLLQLLHLFPSYRLVQLQRLSPSTPHYYVRSVASRASYGDLILLLIIGNNVDTSQFSALIGHLSDDRSLPYLQQSQCLQESFDGKERGGRKDL